MDTESAFESIENQETKEVIDSISGEEFLTEFSRRYKVYEYTEGKGIRITPTIPKHVRKEFLKLQRGEAQLLKSIEKEEDFVTALEKISDEGFLAKNDADLKTIATLTSLVCLDTPFNAEEFWNQFEEKTGMLSQVFTEIVEICGATEKELIRFR